MVMRGPEWNHTARRNLTLKYVRVSSFERDVPGLFKGTRPRVKEDKIGPSVLAWSVLPGPLSLELDPPSGPTKVLEFSERLRPCFPCQNYFSTLSFCEFFLSFEAHSRNSTSAAKALCATESSTWPCDIWGLVFTASETAFLWRLPSCTVTRTIPWFFLFFCIFFSFFKACLSFLSTLLGSLKVLAKFCLMNNEWTDGVGIHKLRNLASPSLLPWTSDGWLQVDGMDFHGPPNVPWSAKLLVCVCEITLLEDIASYPTLIRGSKLELPGTLDFSGASEGQGLEFLSSLCFWG